MRAPRDIAKDRRSRRWPYFRAAQDLRHTAAGARSTCSSSAGWPGFPLPLDTVDQRAGYWWELSMAPVEVCRTIVFTQPRYARASSRRWSPATWTSAPRHHRDHLRSADHPRQPARHAGRLQDHSPSQGPLTLGFGPARFPDRTASLLPGLLAATRPGLPPAGDDELTSTRRRARAKCTSGGRSPRRGNG